MLGSLAVACAFAADANDLCASIRALEGATKGFAALRGAPAEPGQWHSTLSAVAGTGECLIELRRGEYVHTCHGPWGNGVADVNKETHALSTQVWTCLGPAWKRAHSTMDVTLLRDGAHVQFEFETVLRRRQDTGAIAAAAGVPSGAGRQARTRFTVTEVGNSMSGQDADFPWKSQPGQLCAALSKVVGSRGAGFESLRKARDGDDWTSKVNLPGMQDCEISDLGTFWSYRCDALEHPSAAIIRAAQEALAVDVLGCLGTDWEMRRRPGEDGLWRIYLERPDVPRQFVLRTRMDTDNLLELKLELDEDKVE